MTPHRDPLGDEESSEWWMVWGSGFIFGLLTAGALAYTVTAGWWF